jgi:hypothetical protein
VLTAGPGRFDPCVAFPSVTLSVLLILFSGCSSLIDMGCSECTLVVSVASMLCLWFVFGLLVWSTRGVSDLYLLCACGVLEAYSRRIWVVLVACRFCTVLVLFSCCSRALLVLFSCCSRALLVLFSSVLVCFFVVFSLYSRCILVVFSLYSRCILVVFSLCVD